MRNIDEATITQAVLSAMARCTDERLLEVMTGLVKHLHAFAREVKLTEAEWYEGIRFLTDAGHITDDRRQEFILLSDVLGLSMLVTCQNNLKPAGCTEATVLGPFFVEGAPEVENGADISNGAKGAPCLVSGSVRSVDGSAIAGAVINVWQSDDEGFYDVQQKGIQPDFNLRGIFRTGPDGRYWFRAVKPKFYPIPNDGPVGKLLTALGRQPYRPAHLHFIIKANGFDTLTTHIFDPDDPYINADAVLETVLNRLQAAGPSEIRLVVCDLSASPYIDLAGARILHELHQRLEARGIAFRIVGARGRVRDLLRADGLGDKVGGLDRVVTLDSLLAPDAKQPRA